MKQYSNYKPSNIDWIGDIPAHWEALMIKRFTAVRRGASPRPIDDPKYFDEDGEYRWVRIADVTASERYLETTTQSLSELGSSLSVKRHPGDFFLSIAGTVGKPVITRIKCCIHDGFVYFPSLTVNPEFLYYLFSTGLPYQGLGKWGTQLNLNTDTVGEITIPLPTVSEIDSIVNFLDEQTAQLDGLIARKRRLMALLREEKAALINEAVTKGIRPNVPTKSSGIDWLGDVPAHWEVKKLKWVARTNSGGTPTSSRQEEYYDGTIPWIRSLDLNDGIVSSTEYQITELAITESSCRINPVNTVMIAMYGGEGTIGKSGIAKIEATTNQAVCCILPNKKFNPHFLHSLLKFYRPFWMIGAEGTRRDPNISQDDVKNVILPFPPLAEQADIVTYLDEETAKIDFTVGRIEREIELMQEYRTALISEVVTGKVKVA